MDGSHIMRSRFLLPIEPLRVVRGRAAEARPVAALDLHEPVAVRSRPRIDRYRAAPEHRPDIERAAWPREGDAMKQRCEMARGKARARRACVGTAVALGRLRSEAGQGTVEYVGLVLMMAVLMAGVVAAVGGLDDMSAVGRELAGAITKKIIQAVQKVTFS
jgi:hypothetical protein